jgi:glycosyltransferase involved in cell wall biosynthesis
MRVKLGVPLDRPLVGMLGRVSPWKGQDVFLETASFVRMHNPHCHFITIGGVFDKEVQHMDRIVTLHHKLDLAQTVTICGYMKSAREMLAAFDILVLPSTLPDPFPTVILEAMSVGIPVIATSHGGPAEMIIDGECGLLIAPGDPAALAAAIEKLLADPDLRRRMGDAGHVRFMEHFSLDRFLRDMHELYSELV